MKVSSKSRKLLSISAISLLVVCAFHPLVKLGGGSGDHDRSWTKTLPSLISGKRQKIVLIYSNQRSGSTFLGEMFNQNKAAFYLYEPLFPYTPHCGTLNEARLATLSGITQCNFSDTINAFTFAKSLTHYDDRGSKCLRNGVCFASRSRRLSRMYAAACMRVSAREPRNDVCAYPLKPVFLGNVCSSADIVALKILRICSLEAINRLYEEFKHMNKDLYIIHLVRDPRAIISSKLKLQLREEDAIARAIVLCDKMQNNLQYIRREDPAIFVEDGRYIRVRYEEVASNQLRAVREIYGFLGLSVPREVRTWIIASSVKPREEMLRLRKEMDDPKSNPAETLKKYLKLKKQMDDPYGTVRDPQSTIDAWRKTIPLSVMLGVQEKCSGVLELLNYVTAHNNTRLRDLKHKLW